LVMLASVLPAPWRAASIWLLLCFGLVPLQIFPVKLLRDRAHVTIFPNSLNLHLPVKLCLDTQGYMLTHVHTYVIVYAHLSTQKNPATASVFLLAASDHRNQVIVGRYTRLLRA
jgi:hypothetical protein